MGIKVIANIALIISLYFLTYHVYSAILNPHPPLGDSWDYHIPIAHTILDGSFLNPQNFLLPQWYYPGSGEVLNVFLILFNLPLSLSNLVATVILFFVLVRLGTSFKLEKYYALLFSLSFVSLNTVVRWMNFALIDVWIAVFFVMTLVLLKNPQKKASYFLKLGFFLGMMVGTKYTAVLFLAPLIIFYRDVFKFLNLKNIFFFLVPFSIFGLFWYVRNYIYIGNPFYPLPVFAFPGEEIFGNMRVWNVFVTHPIEMADAFFAELKLWIFALPFSVVYLFYSYFKKSYDIVFKLFLLGVINFLIFLNFPTSYEPWIMVSSVRYSYPALIPIFLAVFLVMKKVRKEEILGYFVISNMIFVTSLHYYPKLTLIYAPTSFFVIWLINKKK